MDESHKEMDKDKIMNENSIRTIYSFNHCPLLRFIRKTYPREYKSYYDQTERMKILDLLGNKCVRCGIIDMRVLQIDHVNSNGYQDVQKWGHGRPYYKHILDVKGEGYQLLCANCNWIKRYERKEYN
jgi:hypothetical protein